MQNFFPHRCLSQPERTFLPLVQFFQTLPSLQRCNETTLFIIHSIRNLDFSFLHSFFFWFFFSVSAIPAERIPSDQTHQCRDFLLQGSTVQQTRGGGIKYIIIAIYLQTTSKQFSPAQLRTRCSLLENLQAELSTRSRCMMGDPSMSALASTESTRGTTEGSGGFIENFKVRLKPGLPIGFVFIFLHFSVFREPSECGATLLRVSVFQRRSAEVLHRSRR